MIRWNKEKYISDGRPSFHIYSGPHQRIQFVEIPSEKKENLFPVVHGEVLVTSIIGEGFLVLAESKIPFKLNDSVLIEEGESFDFIKSPDCSNFVVQMIWSPGPNSCSKCKKSNSL